MNDDSEYTEEQDIAVEAEGKPKMVSSKKAIDAKRGVNTFAVDPSELIIIGRDTKHKYGEHALFQDRALEDPDEALVQDMMARGFVSVIDVRKNGPTLEVVAGRRRVIAAREANTRLTGAKKLLVQCKVFRGEDSDASLWLLGENANRKERGLLGLAMDCQNCINFGASDEEVARACGKNVVYMRRMLTLLDLGPEAKKLVQNGTLAASEAIRLAALTRDEQAAEVAKIEAGVYKPTRAAIEGAVKAIRNNTAVTIAPSKGVLRKLYQHKEAKSILGTERYQMLELFLEGKLPRISGLKALMDEISAPKKKAEAVE